MNFGKVNNDFRFAEVESDGALRCILLKIVEVDNNVLLVEDENDVRFVEVDDNDALL